MIDFGGTTFYSNGVGGLYLPGVGPGAGVALAPAVAMENTEKTGLITVDQNIITVTSIPTVDVSISVVDPTSAFTPAGGISIGAQPHIPVYSSVQYEIDKTELYNTQAGLFGGQSLNPNSELWPQMMGVILSQPMKKMSALCEKVFWNGSANVPNWTTTTAITGIVPSVASGNQLNFSLSASAALATTGIVTLANHGLITGNYLKVKTTSAGVVITDGSTTYSILNATFRVKVLSSSTFQLQGATSNVNVTAANTANITYTSANINNVQDAFQGILNVLPGSIVDSVPQGIISPADFQSENVGSFAVSNDVFKAYLDSNARAKSLQTNQSVTIFDSYGSASETNFLGWRIVKIANMAPGTIVFGRPQNMRAGNNTGENPWTGPTIKMLDFENTTMDKKIGYNATFVFSSLLVFPTEAASATL
jgi:hypothetical protein